MSIAWNGAEPPVVQAAGGFGRVRMVVRFLTLAFVTYFGMIFVLFFNLVERAIPLGVAHWLVCLWGRICLALCGLRIERKGSPMPDGGAVVANHLGWIDIFTLLSADRVYFVSKAEVAKWPVVGILSRQIDPVYINRRRSEAKLHERQILQRLRRGDRLCFFPEGTSTDGQRVLPFRSTLFSAFLTPEMREALWVQPVTLVYRPNDGLPASFYGWWGDMNLAKHIGDVFALSSGGVVEVIHHPPLRAADFEDRKALAAACEERVRSGLEAALEQRREAG